MLYFKCLFLNLNTFEYYFLISHNQDKIKTSTTVWQGYFAGGKLHFAGGKLHFAGGNHTLRVATILCGWLPILQIAILF